MIKNRDVYQRDPGKVALLNNGVATVGDVLTDDERRTLRFELEHFVCEGEYQRGLVRILESYLTSIGQPEQPAAWVSGFFGSGKSHLVKMLRALWIDFTFQEDGATARGLARLSEDVRDLLKELSTHGRRHHGLHAAAGTLGAGARDSVRLAVLGIAFKSAGLPESYPQAQFCLWLRRNGLYDPVCASVEAEGKDFRRELNDLYVSPLIAKALIQADGSFAMDERAAKDSLRAQFVKPKDITNDEFVAAVQDALTIDGDIPATVIILDEVQQYIGDDSSRSYAVQEVVEACSKRFGDRVLFVGTGQTALSGTPALQRLQGRFTVNVELSDQDVETVTRRVVLAKRPDRVGDIKSILSGNAGEIDRQLMGTKIGPRTEDQAILVEDYPLLPVRRRFWEQVLRAVDKAGTAGQLRTQLRIVYDAIQKTADLPLGSVVPADFLFDEINANLLQSGVLLREIHEIIQKQDDGTADGKLKARLCALVFLIRKLPREAGVDAGIRATADALADLLVANLAEDGIQLRMRIPQLLEQLGSQGVLIKLDNEYSLQTRESSDWEQEFRTRADKLANDPGRLSNRRGQLLMAAVQNAVGSLKLPHGKSKVTRKVSLHFGSEAPSTNGQEIPVWVRDGWGVEEKTVVSEARALGQDSPVLAIYLPKTQAESLRKTIANQSAAEETLNFKGVPTTKEGIEAREAMQTRLAEARNNLNALVGDLLNAARVFQGGGNERFEVSLLDKVKTAAEAAVERLFYEFKHADDPRWDKVIDRAKKGAEHPLEAVDFAGKTEDHSVCATVLSFVGSGKKGKDIRDHFEASPYGWPRDAVDGALISLFAADHLRATHNSVPLKPGQLDQAKVSVTDFRRESITISAKERITLRKLLQDAGIDCKPNEEANAATPLLQKLQTMASEAGGEPPLPERPTTQHLLDLQALAGNEQLKAILGQAETLRGNFKEWAERKTLIGKRLPAFRNLEILLGHAKSLPVAKDIGNQVAAIRSGRTVLDPADSLPSLVSQLLEALRAAFAAATSTYEATYDREMAALEASESWPKLTSADQTAILESVGIRRLKKGPVGTEQDVLDTLGKTSPETWTTQTAALPQLFAEARRQADKKLEPKIQHVKLRSHTLRSAEEIKAWLAETERSLIEKLKDGPVAVS